MFRVTDTRNAPRNWSGTSTMILLAFIVIGTLQAGAHHDSGAVVCFVLAACYPPLRILRGRLTRSRNHR
jgi:hypothetical protein